MSEKHHAFAEKVASHIAVIINGVRVCGKTPTGENREEEGVGIGSAVLWNGRKLILTAKHVVEGADPLNLRFFLRQGGKIDWAVKPDRPSIGTATYLQVEDIVRCASEDLACIVLSNNAEDRLDFAALPMAFGKAPPAGGGMLLYGCPYDQNVPVAAARAKNALHVGFAARPRGCWAVVRSGIPPLFPSSFDPKRHFLLHYDPAVEGALPYGFSGAGVWYRRSGRGDIWLADPVLAGVQTSWHKPSHAMIVIKSRVVRSFLTTKFPK